MIILPAIDLKGGRCVRLLRGDFSTVHQVADDPVQTAAAFVRAGAKQIHMVDLDGAREGVRKNTALVQRVSRETGLKIELGGGIRNMADLEAVFAMGVYRAVIGSAAVENQGFVAQAVQTYGERIAVGIDALDGEVRTAGWMKGSGINELEFAKKMEDVGVKTLIFTDIATDGTLSGPSLLRLKMLKAAVCCQVIASGGVSSNGDLRNLRDAGMDGAIVGKAFYAGKIDLEQAIKEAGMQC